MTEAQTKKQLEAEERCLSPGDDDDDHQPTMATAFIVMGLDIEDNQYVQILLSCLNF